MREQMAMRELGFMTTQKKKVIRKKRNTSARKRELEEFNYFESPPTEEQNVYSNSVVYSGQSGILNL